MPFVPHDAAKGAPAGPHLALMTEEGPLAIVEGSSLWLVEDASRMDKIFPLILKKVTAKALTFVLVDAEGGKTEYKYQLVTGKPLNVQALKRMVANGAKLQQPR